MLRCDADELGDSRSVVSIGLRQRERTRLLACFRFFVGPGLRAQYPISSGSFRPRGRMQFTRDIGKHN
jgi:hypothetical protein